MILTTIKGKVLIQVEGMDPVEVGTIDIPIHAGKAEKIGEQTAQATVKVGIDEDAYNLNTASILMERRPAGPGDGPFLTAFTD